MGKPYTQHQLGDMIRRWVRRLGAEAETPSGRSEVVDAERHMTPSRSAKQATVLSTPATGLAQHVLDQLRALRRPGRPDPVAKILTSFLESSAKYVRTIDEATIRRDAEAIFQAAHALKSSSAMIGAMALSESAKNLEQLGRQGMVTEHHAQLAEFKARYEAAKQAVQEELGKEAA